mmetsp:Transcript_19776/g.27815  ORF Transcript_19776/g.27815 Transcript_19776/m.27815 type:complete len:228 (-) Transcript_19776:137-820(-)|eukprot:CAMPEP_0184857894 /NCGR_PEP_ID=MMETSP0580-20130426/3042_1 /TAXON_ID=1118495 /ORGANISM="Dactyliosolen fragilissimus" /LENGTH=227 /DNA_ID=CAMNT_0027353757 /DNA_START=128 /DNA_END=811 /DNA_ORIENTATION=-
MNDSSNAPSWLTDDPPAATSAPSLPPPSTPTNDLTFDATENQSAASSMLRSVGASADAAAEKAAEEAAAEEDIKALTGIIIFMRFINFASAGVVIAKSIIVMSFLPSPGDWVLAFYSLFFGILIALQETQLVFFRTIIAMNFGFLFNSILRFFFYMLMASIMLSFGDLFGDILAIVLCAVALFNTYVLCRYPSYRKIREQLAQEEDKRIKEKINRQVRKQVVRSMTS